MKNDRPIRMMSYG